MIDISKKRICADEALAVFLALGPSRTLPRLREQYCRDTSVKPPALSTLKRWSRSDEWTARAREHDLAVQAATSEKAIEREAEQRVEISLIVEDAYRDVLERVRQLLPQTSGDGMTMELVTAAGLLHGQLMEIQRGKMPDQAFLEKIVQHMSEAPQHRGDQPAHVGQCQQGMLPRLLDLPHLRRLGARMIRFDKFQEALRRQGAGQNAPC